MCGRGVSLSGSDVVSWLEVALVGDGVAELAGSFNLSPTDSCVVVEGAGAQRRARVATWGMRSRRGTLTINARDDRLYESPMWRGLLQEARVVVGLRGYYEWSGPRRARQPWYFERRDRAPLAVAGLCSRGAVVLVTMAASSGVDEVHDRMPAYLGEQGVSLWLAGAEVEAVEALRGAGEGALERWPVSFAVNDASAEGAALIEPMIVPQGDLFR